MDHSPTTQQALSLGVHPMKGAPRGKPRGAPITTRGHPPGEGVSCHFECGVYQTGADVSNYPLGCQSVHRSSYSKGDITGDRL